MKICLVGDGEIAKYHRKAIEKNGLNIHCVYDPPKGETNTSKMYDCDLFVICSPSNLHIEQIQNFSVSFDPNALILVEQPVCLPWEAIPYQFEHKVSCVLPLRYLHVPDDIEIMTADLIVNEDYFDSWKGNWKNTGGPIFDLMLTYLDFAVLHNVPFTGTLSPFGEQIIGLHVKSYEFISICDDVMNQCYEMIYKVYKDSNGEVIGSPLYDIKLLYWVMNNLIAFNGSTTNKDRFNIHFDPFKTGGIYGKLLLD